MKRNRFSGLAVKANEVHSLSGYMRSLKRIRLVTFILALLSKLDRIHKFYICVYAMTVSIRSVTCYFSNKY
ncbi:reverse transcriptase [Gossypium australe]|uniref:Reverse transcriptase n=1 Tax=Gossypium australe TaxID=47621 RepID=A0A5B6VCC4_9ROSI|nr:reverse transcriptase [Gossypium australe]